MRSTQSYESDSRRHARYRSELFLVGDLHVDVGQLRVTRAGVEITLPYLSFQLLLALIRVAPDIISNDLLMARVWPGLNREPGDRDQARQPVARGAGR